MTGTLDGSSAAARRRAVNTPVWFWGDAMPFGEEMRVMLEYACRARPGEFSAVMHAWAKQLAVERPELRDRFSCPVVEERLDAPRACAVFWSGKGSGKYGQIVAIVAPQGSTLVLWSLPSQWTEVEKVWQAVLAELVRRGWCDPETAASEPPPKVNSSGFVKKNSRVHNRYIETANHYAAVHFDVEKTKHWYSTRFPRFTGSRATFERMLSYAESYQRWLKEGQENVK